VIVSLSAVFDAVIVTVHVPFVPPLAAVTQLVGLKVTSPLVAKFTVALPTRFPAASRTVTVAAEVLAWSAGIDCGARARLTVAPVAAFTVIVALVPVTVASDVSVAETVCEPAVDRATDTTTLPVPGEKVVSAGRIAAPSVLVNVTVPP
jgi:uncharacterized membrane protein